MAYKLIWSPEARDDLRDIVRFIARDSRQRAEAFGFRLIRETDKLQESQRSGVSCQSIVTQMCAKSL